MFDVFIYKGQKSLTQGGQSFEKVWIVEFSQKKPKPFFSHRGWCGSKEPLAHHKLIFSSLENALRFAKSTNLSYLCC